MDKIIIGIHGLGNKPSTDVYSCWWRESILDGLKLIDKQRNDVNFRLVYWADVLNPAPQDPLETNRDSSCFIKEPYIPLQHKIASYEAARIPWALDKFKKELKAVIYTATSFINIDVISDSFLKHWFKELNDYYNAKFKMSNGVEKPVKDIINDRLVKVIYENRHKRIMLVAHSMGALIAYDVLTNLPQYVTIDTFVTMGSPLGAPSLIKKLASEKGMDSIENMATPESVSGAWYNIMDEKDSITLKHRLRDYFKENGGNVKVVDVAVNNNYQHGGLRNPHKAFGYLASPEFANIVNNFVQAKDVSIFRKIGGVFADLFRWKR